MSSYKSNRIFRKDLSEDQFGAAMACFVITFMLTGIAFGTITGSIAVGLIIVAIGTGSIALGIMTGVID